MSNDGDAPLQPALTRAEEKVMNDRAWLFETREVIFRDPAVPLGSDELERRRQVYKQAVAHPDTFDMRDWETVAYDLRDWPGGTPSCRTTRCIAGWAQFFARGEVNSDDILQPDVAADAVTVLALTEDEYFGPVNIDEDYALFYLPDDVALARLRELCYFGPGDE